MNKTTIKSFLLLVISVLAFLCSSCTDDDPIKQRTQAVKHLYRHGKVKIAVANSFEDNQSKMWQGAVLAQKTISEKEICPVEVELVKFDDGGTPISGNRTAYEIVSDKEICAVIGHGYSDISLPCSLIYQYYGILTFNFISTIHSLTERNNPLIVSNMPSDTNVGDEIAQILEKKGLRRVLIYYLENTSGTSLSNAFELSCNNRGLEVVSRESYDLTGTTQLFERSIRRWKNNFVFDAVFLAGRMPSLGMIIKLMRENGVTCPIVGADPFDDPLLTALLDESENGKIFAVSNYNTESKNIRFHEFFQDFVKEFGTEPDQEALQAYDALMVLARAINQSAGASPHEIVEVLKNNLWYEAAGPYTFYPNGAIKDFKLTTKVFKNGKFEEIDL